jgi:hypothetical protein
MGFLSSIFGGGDRNESRSTTSTSATETGLQAGGDGFLLGENARIDSSSSVQSQDFSDRSVSNIDSSDRSVSNTDSSRQFTYNSQFFSDESDRSVSNIDKSVNDNSQFFSDESDRSVTNTDSSSQFTDNTQNFSDSRNQSTTQIDESVDSRDQSVINNVIDFGAINRAFNTADKSLSTVAGLASGNQAGLVEMFTRVVDELGMVQSSALESVNAGFSEAFDQVQQSAATSEERGLASVIGLSKNMFYVLGGVGAIVALSVAYK